MKRIFLILIAAIACGLSLESFAAAKDGETQSLEAVKTRSFRLEYGATLHELPVGARVRVWLPVPQSDDHQQIKSLERDLPAQAQFAVEPKYGNRILYFETVNAAQGELTFRTNYRVRRQEVRALRRSKKAAPLGEAKRKLFLSPNTNVPLQGKPLRLLDGMRFNNDSLTTARRLYDRVDEHVRYDKSQSGYGRGDVLWVCDSRFGNCTDFHSLFISLARSQGLPARFEIGFPLPAQRGKGAIAGYHCWASFHDAAKGWTPVDISEADKHPELKQYYFGSLTENRVHFTTGRDIELAPQQEAPPLNYFVFPHVEVDGKVWKKLTMYVGYRDE